MTACTNNGGKARRVVTAALVGVLSVGAVPAIALATGTGDVSLQSVDPKNDVDLVKAQDGTGHSVSEDALKTGVSFENGNKQYLVPTWVSVEGGAAEKVDSDWTVTYIVPVASSVQGSEGAYEGFFKDGIYYTAPNKSGEVVNLSGYTGTSYTISAGVAKAYFTGNLYDGNGDRILVTNGDYAVNVSDSDHTKSFNFEIVAAKSNLDGLYVYDASGSDTSDTTFTFDAEPQTIGLADADGDVFDTTGYTFTVRDAKGVAVPGNTPTEAGTYTAELRKDGVSVKNISFTIDAIDLSKATLHVDDFTSGPNSGTVAQRNGKILDALTIDGEPLTSDLKSCIDITVVGPEGVQYFADAKGIYTVTLKSNRPNDTSILSSGTIEVAVLDTDVFTDGATLKYGDMTVTSDLFVNLFKGEKFDASKLSVVYGGKTYKGDDIEVTVDGDATVEGKPTVYVRVKPFQKDGDWLGGVTDFDLHVTGADLDANQRLYFYLDGKLTGDYATVTYDGEDWLKKLEVVVKDADGNEIDPSNYEVKVTKDGKEVDSVVDHGDYEVKVTGKTFTFDGGVGDTLYLTVDPLEVDWVDVVPDLTANGTSYLTWTGEELKPTFKFFDYVDDEYVEVEVPAEAYEVTYVRTKPLPEKKDAVVKDEGTYVAYFDAAVDVENYRFAKDVRANFEVTKKDVFLDVPMNEWYSQGVYEAAKLGYMNGDGAGATFSPMRELTRAEAACVLFNMAGGDTMYSNETIPGYNTEGKVYETGFSDVAGNEFFAKAVAWCKATGIINGYADGTFGVSRKVTNEEFACMLANYAKAKNEYKAVDADEVLAAYPDASVVSDWAEDAVAWCVSEGIMGGGANISPAGSILRMRAATMAVNAQPKKLGDLVITIKPVNPDRQ
ncbi:S-layer homology domain-containing protein [Thermophilibacter sp. ET337]|uniref:S-layer homology domain-containing protein n=1 Tax=Thermophilibacter sp. ET337 TaxID=2973084 RepID=UPI0021ACCE6B|nr:S-layer homology domain-containing protein [Thermophilibacter sp. ET337]MCR8908844.1 S-layer homology domain-containing protein [Thermophilibacter sp. ET337]